MLFGVASTPTFWYKVALRCAWGPETSDPSCLRVRTVSVLGTKLRRTELLRTEFDSLK